MGVGSCVQHRVELVHSLDAFESYVSSLRPGFEKRRKL